MYLVHARDTLTCTRGTRQLACHTRASRARYARSSSALSVRWEGTWAGGSFHCCMLTSECRRPGSPTAVCKHPRRTAGKGKGTSGKGVGTRHDMQHKETPADSMCSADATHTGHACTCYTTMLPAPACAERQGHGSTVRARRQRARRQRAAVCGRERARKGGTRPSRPFPGAPGRSRPCLTRSETPPEALVCTRTAARPPRAARSLHPTPPHPTHPAMPAGQGHGARPIAR